MEFGAGRGKLSHWIHRALQNPEGQGVAMETSQDLQLLLVERCSTRFKVEEPGNQNRSGSDKYLCKSMKLTRTRTGPAPLTFSLLQVDGKHQGSANPFERLQVDIQHLDLSKNQHLLGLYITGSDPVLTRFYAGKVPVLREKALPLVGVGKHLCGAATGETCRSNSAARSRFWLWFCPQIWPCAAYWTRPEPNQTPSRFPRASEGQNPALVPVRFWASLWRYAATTAVNGVTTWVSSSSSREDSDPPSSPLSAACPAGPPVARRPITTEQPVRAERPIRAERLRIMKKRSGWRC